MARSSDSSRRPTGADVARLAGVSPTTVSFVLNDRHDQSISAQTRDRVLRAIDELGYRRDLAALGLRTQRTSIIGYVTDEAAGNPFAGTAIAGAHDVARRHRSLLLVVHTKRDARTRRSVIEELLDRRVDSILFAVVGTRRVTLPDIVHKVPVVMVNCFTSLRTGTDAPAAVLPDEQAAGYSAARVLLAAGHRKIVVLAGFSGSWATRERLRGVRRALIEAGVDPGSIRIRHGNFRSDSGFDLTQEILSEPDLPTAVLCGNDRMALGAYLALGQAGLSIPGDVSVMGFDDQDELATDIRPALTTIRLPYYEMGAWAAKSLLGQPQPPPLASPRGQPATYLPCPVMMRGSVGEPRPRMRE